MKSNHILIIGGVVTIALVILWYFEKISEPMAALGSAVLTLIGFIVSGNSEKKQTGDTKMKIKQEHSGEGDNIGRDKIVSNNPHSKQEGNTNMNVKQKHSGTGDNVGRDKTVN